jgi:hypothetical protein
MLDKQRWSCGFSRRRFRTLTLGIASFFAEHRHDLTKQFSRRETVNVRSYRVRSKSRTSPRLPDLSQGTLVMSRNAVGFASCPDPVQKKEGRKFSEATIPLAFVNSDKDLLRFLPRNVKMKKKTLKYDSTHYDKYVLLFPNS